MKEHPRISVILPVHNAARFVRQATQSILDQTFTGFELIAIDDGSRDASAAILNDMAKADARIRVVSRAHAVTTVGGYREKYRLAQDMDLFLRLGEVGQLANLSEPLLLYRWHKDSLSHRKNQLDGLRTRASMIREACQRRGIPEKEIEQ